MDLIWNHGALLGALVVWISMLLVIVSEEPSEPKSRFRR